MPIVSLPKQHNNNALLCALASFSRALAMKHGSGFTNNCLQFRKLSDDSTIDAVDLAKLQIQGSNQVVPLLNRSDYTVTLSVDARDDDQVIWTSDFVFEKDGVKQKSPFKTKEYFCSVEKGDKFEIIFDIVPSETECHTVDITMYKLVPGKHIQIELESPVADSKVVWINILQQCRSQTVRYGEILQKHTVVTEGSGHSIKYTWKQRIDPFIQHQRLAHLFTLVMNESPDVSFASYTVKHDWVTLVVVASIPYTEVIKFVEKWLEKNWSKIYSK